MKRINLCTSVIILVSIFFLLTSCHDTSDLTFKAVVRGQLPGGMVSRSVMPQEGYAVPGYYVATLTSKSGSKSYTGTTTDIANGIEFDNIVAGSYTLKVDGYTSESDRTWMMTGSVSADIHYNSAKEFIVPIDVISSGEDLTSTVSIEIDWSGTSKRVDTVALYVSDSPDSSTLDTWTKVAEQEIEFIDSNPGHMSFRQKVPVGLNKFMKFLFYENGRCIGYSIPESARFYSGQTVTTNDPFAYIYDDSDNPFRLPLELSDIELTYGEDDTSLRLYWVNPHVYDKIIIQSWMTAKPDFVMTQTITKNDAAKYIDSVTGKMLVTFNNLEKETEYACKMYVQYGTGQESEHAEKTITTATLVKTITLENSLDLEAQRHFSPGLSCIVTAKYIPVAATLGNGFSWESSDTSIATVEAINKTQAKITAVGSGKVEIACTAPIGTVSSAETVLVSYAVPTGLTAEPIEKGISLRWQDDNPDITGYRIYRSNSSGDFDLIGTVAAGVKTYSDTSVKTGTSYSYKVSSYGLIDGIECESLSEASAIVAVKNPTISIVLPEAPSDINAVFSQYSGTTFFSTETLDIELTSPIAHADDYRWYLNGVLQKHGDYESIKSISINKDTNGINLTQIAPMQDLMLVVRIGNLDFSSTLRVYMVDKEQIVDVSEIQLHAPSRVTYGGPQKITATVSPENATVKNLIWSSSDESLATVAREGTVTVHKAGQVTITATSEVSNVFADAIIECYVPVADVEILSPSRNVMFVNGQNGYNQIQLTASVTGIDGLEPSDAQVKWHSENIDIATIDEYTGIITAIGAGAATFILSSSADESVTQSIVLHSVIPRLYVDNIDVTGKSFGLGYSGLAWDTFMKDIELRWTGLPVACLESYSVEWEEIPDSSRLSCLTLSNESKTSVHISKNGARIEHPNLRATIKLGETEIIKIETECAH